MLSIFVVFNTLTDGTHISMILFDMVSASATHISISLHTIQCVVSLKIFGMESVYSKLAEQLVGELVLYDSMLVSKSSFEFLFKSFCQVLLVCPELYSADSEFHEMHKFHRQRFHYHRKVAAENYGPVQRIKIPGIALAAGYLGN